MNHVISIPEGIDSNIQAHQTLLYNRLSLLWGEMGLTADNFEMYGRCYRNYKDGGYVPQAFTGAKDKDYRPDMFFDDKVAAIMWYDLEDEGVNDSQQHQYIVNLYGFVNLNNLKPDVTIQRMDNAVINDVCKICNHYGFLRTNVYRDIDAVLQRYSGIIKTSALNEQMQPLFGFRIRMKNKMLLDDCASPSITYPTYQSAMTISYTVIFKDNPNTGMKQRLGNGVMAQIEFPVGQVVEIPYLVGKVILKSQLLNNFPVVLEFDSNSGSFVAPSEFYNNDVLIIDVNVN